MQTELRDFSYSFGELNINIGMVEEAMGYLAGQSPEPIPAMIATALEECEPLCDIRGSLFISSDFACAKSGFFEIADVTFNGGTKIVRQLENAEGGILFICSAGKGISEKSKSLMASADLIEGYILDVIGSVTVEAAVEKMQDYIEVELTGHGLKLTNRYSPGYCGWSLEEQKLLFGLFPDNQCGIRLTDSFLMYPVKSVSGVMGFGKNVKKGAYECQLCELVTCMYRKIRLARHK